MKKFISRSHALYVVAVLIVMALSNRYVAAIRAAENSDQAVVKADRAFSQAAAKGDKASADKFLDTDFTWTNAEGKTWSRAEVLAEIPKLAVDDGSGVNTEHRDYGQVFAVMASQEKNHALRVWVKRGEDWRLLLYHEVSQVEHAPPSRGTGVNKCENPCKTLPFQPKNEAEQAVIKSWQELETGVTNHDASAWAPHVDTEFVTVSSNADHLVSKADRIATLNSQKESGVGSAPAPLVSAQMFDFDDAIVMTCLHEPYKGKPIHVSRVWIKRDGRWVMSISFQTTIQAAEAKQ